MHSSRNGFGRFLSRFTRHEAAVCCAIVAGVLIFALIAAQVKEGATQACDRQLLLAMRRPGDLMPRGSQSFQEAARDVTALGGSTVLILVTAAAVGFLVLDRKRRMAAFLCASVAAGWTADTLMKDLFHRPRPEIVPHSVYVSTASFPSGHSMRSAIVYLTLGALLARSHPSPTLKIYFLALAVLLTVLVGLTRVYLGVHWPTDVLAGWIAGCVWALLSGLVARLLRT